MEQKEVNYSKKIGDRINDPKNIGEISRSEAREKDVVYG